MRLYGGVRKWPMRVMHEPFIVYDLMHMKDADPFFRVANYATLLLSKLMSLMCFGISFRKVE